MDTGTAEATSPDPLRTALIDTLCARGAIRSPQVEAAMRAVDRALFLPGTPAAEVYTDVQIVTNRGPNGQASSSVSQPTVVARMLEQLDLYPGHRVLEIGSGGWNAALMAHIVGPAGQVTSIDIDPDVTERAEQTLATAGYQQVQVVCADGEHGHPQRAPYDRIIVTVGAWDLPAAWLDQLDPAGRLVVPLRIRGLTRIVAFERENDNGIWRSQSMELAGFVPIQGIGAHTGQTIPLRPTGAVSLHIDDADHPAAAAVLGQALDHPETLEWTGVTIPYGTPYSPLDLWLTTMPGYARLNAEPEAIKNGLVTPTFPWGSSAAHNDDSFAYLTERQAIAPTDTTRGTGEIGIRAHGPHSTELAHHLAHHIRTWDTDHRTNPDPTINIRPRDTTTQPPGHLTTPRRNVDLTLTWTRTVSGVTPDHGSSA